MGVEWVGERRGHKRQRRVHVGLFFRLAQWRQRPAARRARWWPAGHEVGRLDPAAQLIQSHYGPAPAVMAQAVGLCNEKGGAGFWKCVFCDCGKESVTTCSPEFLSPTKQYSLHCFVSMMLLINRANRLSQAVFHLMTGRTSMFDRPWQI